MKDLAPAFARIAKIAAQFNVLHKKQEAEFQRINKEGRRVARIALKRAKLVRGETLIQIGKWDRGIYEGAEIHVSTQDKWWRRIHYRSVLKSGRPGNGKHIVAGYVEHPADVARDVRTIGKLVDGKVMKE